MDVKINVDRLNAAVAKGQPKFEAALEAKPVTATMRSVAPLLQAKAVGIVSLPQVDAALLTFCTAWPKVNPFLNLGLKYASWFLPAASIALAKAVLEAINKEIVPALCGQK